MMMKRYFQILAVVCSIALGYYDLNAQIISTAKPLKDTVTIGDIVQVELYAKVPTSADCKGVNFSNFGELQNLSYLLDSLQYDAKADLEILDYGKWAFNDFDQMISLDKIELTTESGFVSFRNTIKIAIYNHGQFKIPGITIVADSTAKVIQTQPALLTVLLPSRVAQSDSLSINPIKDIIAEQKTWVDYLWIGWIIAGILALWLVWKWVKNRRKKVIQPLINNPQAHETALKGLQQLKVDKIWLEGKHKSFQTQLTDIMRQYIHERYSISAPKMTSSQILSALKKTGISKELMHEMDEILDIADLVKFAEAEPGIDIHAQFLDRAIDFVHQTKAVN